MGSGDFKHDEAVTIFISQRKWRKLANIYRHAKQIYVMKNILKSAGAFFNVVRTTSDDASEQTLSNVVFSDFDYC